MRPSLVLLALALLPLVPLAQAQDGIDATIHLDPTTAPRIDGPAGLVSVNATEAGERYVFDLKLTKPHTAIEIRGHGFDIERPRQLVPSMVVPDDVYPLFTDFPNERVWDVDGAARIFFTSGTARDVVLRLGISGPDDLRIVIERDVTPPTFRLGPVENVTHYGFYQETYTEELAHGDLQIRRAGTNEWIENPTPILHFRQRFPIQGLDADTEYEARVVLTDWAQNVATSDTYRIASIAAPVLPKLTITPIFPEPNATIPRGETQIRARVESPDSPIDHGTLNVFFDKRPLGAAATWDGDILVYTPPEELRGGKHTIGIEISNEAGGRGERHWSFEVERSSLPTPAWAALAAGALAAVAVARRRG